MPHDDNDGPEFDIDPAILERAEMAISALGDGYRDTVRDKADDMTRLIDTLAAGTADDTGARDALFRHGHELAGQGGTFGFAPLSDIGRSLCDFIDTRNGKVSSDDVAVFRAHVAAASQVVNREMSGADSTDTLLSDLRELVRRHMA